MNEKSPRSNREGRVLSVSERESLENSLRIHTGIVEATSGSYGTGITGGNTAVEGMSTVLPGGMQIDKKRADQRVRDIARALEEGSPRALSASEKDAAFKRVKELEDKFQKDNVLETREELHVLKRDNPAWMTALDKARRRPGYEDDINEWKNLNRMIEPNDPDADNLHRLRRAK